MTVSTITQAAGPEPPPEHVLSAFGVRDDIPELLDSEAVAYRFGDAVLVPAVSAAESAWSARLLHQLRPEGVRVARPLRATDGRWVVSGWTAHRRLTGRPEPRHDEVVAASLRLHEATAKESQPRFLPARDDLYARADRMAWQEQDVALDPHAGGDLFTALAGRRRPLTTLRPQVVHGDLFGNVLFAGTEPPGIVDFTPYWRPMGWAAAVVVVDALAWGGADDGLPQRWAHLPEWPQCLLRALLFRVALHAQHPRSSAVSLAGLERATAVLLRQFGRPGQWG